MKHWNEDDTIITMVGKCKCCIELYPVTLFCRSKMIKYWRFQAKTKNNQAQNVDFTCFLINTEVNNKSVY